MNTHETQFKPDQGQTAGRTPNGRCRDGDGPAGSHDRKEHAIVAAHYSAVFQSSFDGMLLTETDGRIIAANPSACRILGRSEAQLLTLKRGDLVHPEDDRVTHLIAERNRTGRYNGELTMLHGDGTTFEAEVASVVVTTEHGQVTSMIIRDVSERKRAQERVREQAEWLDKANEAIFATDLEHRIIYWNEGAERMCGWKAAEVLGQSIAELLAKAGISDPQAQAAAGQMTDWRGTIACRQRDGQPQAVATSATVLRDRQGRPTGRLVLSTDITEQTRLQEKYERALRLQSVGMLAAGVAHDFNNILTPIGLVETMLRDRLHSAEDREMLQTIRSCVARGATVARQILGFAQGVGSGTRVVQIQQVLRELAAIVRETFPRSITFEPRIPGDLWSIMANPTQIHQMLLNLCVNARDAMGSGGRLTLSGQNCLLDEETASRIAGARKGAWVVLSVEDTGSGIAPELLGHIWEPFFTTKTGEKGTGLGLSVVRGIVETHSGFISVETKVGSGTTFRVYLPAIGSSLPAYEAKVALGLPKGNGENILLADDEVGIRETTKTVLTNAGYTVVAAANGAEALAKIKDRPEEFDLVLTDIDMPELDGAKLAHSLAALRPSLKVMAMSGFASKSPGVDAARFSGGFLPKPFTMDALLRGVWAALQRT